MPKMPKPNIACRSQTSLEMIIKRAITVKKNILIKTYLMKTKINLLLNRIIPLKTTALSRIKMRKRLMVLKVAKVRKLIVMAMGTKLVLICLTTLIVRT